MTGDGETIAKFFCKNMGYPGIEKSFFSVDNNFDYNKAGTRIKYASSASQIDFEKKTIKVTLSAEPCKPVKVYCKGAPQAPDINAMAKNQTRHPVPKIKKIEKCSDSPADLSSWIKGDAGSVYTFICPENCNSAGTLVGSGL